jgi:hypothetical protein
MLGCSEHASMARHRHPPLVITCASRSKKPSLVMPSSAPGIGSVVGLPPQAMRILGAVSVRVPAAAFRPPPPSIVNCLTITGSTQLNHRFDTGGE